MEFLLDTHVFLWWMADDAKLSWTARTAIANAENKVFVSAVSGWEIATKVRLGTLTLPETHDLFMLNALRGNTFGVLPITLAHTLREFRLPPHHPDPFDRLLVAQAKVEEVALVTDDASVTQYNVRTLW